MSRWLLAALLSGALIPGCAFALSGPDPGRPRNQIPDCDTSKGLVALDGAMATAMGVATLSLLSESEPAIALLPLAIGALYLGGAVKGNTAVNKCRAAMDLYNSYPGERVAGEDIEAEEKRAQHPGRRRLKRTELLPPQTQPTPRPEPGPQQPYPQEPYPQQPGLQQPPQTASPPQQPPQTPQPRQPPRRPPPPQPDDDEEWTDFWREVP